MTPASATRELTRRSAVAGLASALSSPALAGLRSEPDFDVLIVGAGPAGIAAARRIAGTKWKFGIIEASDRRGGRCFTESTTFGLPYDQGACSIHVPPRSSLAGLAARNGIELYPDPEILQIRLRGRKAFDRGLEEVHSKNELEQFYTNRVRCYAAIANAAGGKDDISCADALPADLGDWRKMMEFFLGPYRFGAELKELSAKEYAVSLDRGPALLCRLGAGILIGKLALGIPTKFFSPVTLVDWGDRSVVLETGGGTVSARAVIVTVNGCYCRRKDQVQAELAGALRASVRNIEAGQLRSRGHRVQRQSVGRGSQRGHLRQGPRQQAGRAAREPAWHTPFNSEGTGKKRRRAFREG
jgi:hypothetical protein